MGSNISIENGRDRREAGILAANVPVTPAKKPRPIAPADAALKRTVDIAVSVIALAAASPLMLATALAIKLHDGGPILYRRRCVGTDGNEFDAFKFRSMRVDADEVLNRDAGLRREFEVNFKLQRDPRVTAIGRFIRRTSIDELPQFFNVLLGDMSAVGPRMITRDELAKYGDCAPNLLSVKPGVTGYWQTEGRQMKSYEERVRMDMFYVEHRSFWFDLRILLRTPFKVLKREGAY